MEKTENKTNYPQLSIDKKIILEFKKDEGFKLSKAGVTMAAAHPELGFNSLEHEGKFLLICTRYTENNKSWNRMKKVN